MEMLLMKCHHLVQNRLRRHMRNKVAAMKAAELVNKNLVGFGRLGYLSTLTKRRSYSGLTKRTALVKR
ncbi:hypothetical protein OPV22_013145 [Ensete ventricosum]|uniref:Uncharacterized protein n=1 Tax=Ensete ventricosum TaxID=4639 RepID=A0AAV8PHT0_ENSVE|nr:hypothetical protein OPV22_013145 [Ensete ventricosum]